MLSEKEKQEVLVRIVDDDRGLREAVSFDLECRGWRTQMFESAKQFLSSDDRYMPGCLVLDIRMPEMNGLELQRELIARGHHIPIIILTGHGDLDVSVKAFRYGAFDFLQKPVAIDEFVQTIERACELSYLEREGQLNARDCYWALRGMSEREQEIIKLLMKGLENRQIAGQLALSIRTVQGHRNNLYRKLRVHSLEELTKALERAHAYEATFEI